MAPHVIHHRRDNAYAQKQPLRVVQLLYGYGQAGKAKKGGPRVKPGTSKGDSYCARSLGIKKRLSKKKQNDPNTPNNLSRKRWKCSGAKSKK